MRCDAMQREELNGQSEVNKRADTDALQPNALRSARDDELSESQTRRNRTKLVVSRTCMCTQT